MALDPWLAAELARQAADGTPAYADGTVGQARARLAARLGTGATAPGVRTRDLPVPGERGPVPVRLYEPDGPTGAPRPILVFLHGGGWVVGDLDTHDRMCGDLAASTGSLVAAVDYARAPEHRFPTAVRDCYDATAWMSRHGHECGGDPGCLLLFGESAGGNLAAAVTLSARDRGGPVVAHQFLVYPVTDLAMDTPSYLRYGEGYGLSRRDMLWFRDHYVPEPAQRGDPLAAPLRATDHTGLPPALVVTAGFDPLRDEGEAYAERLRAAGVPVRLRRHHTLAHGFLDQVGTVPAARRARDELVADIRAVIVDRAPRPAAPSPAAPSHHPVAPAATAAVEG